MGSEPESAQTEESPSGADPLDQALAILLSPSSFLTMDSSRGDADDSDDDDEIAKQPESPSYNATALLPTSTTEEVANFIDSFIFEALTPTWNDPVPIPSYGQSTPETEEDSASSTVTPPESPVSATKELTKCNSVDSSTDEVSSSSEGTRRKSRPREKRDSRKLADHQVIISS